MTEPWMVWAIGTCMFAAASGLFYWLGFVKGQEQAKAWLDYVLATQVNANVAAAHANVAQELKDKRTAAYFASKQGQASSQKPSRRDRDRVDQMINGHDEGH